MGALNLFPELLLLGLSRDITAPLLILQLAFELPIIGEPVWIHSAISHTRQNCATWFRFVRTVPEAATRAYRSKIVKRVLQTRFCIPGLKLPHPWGVDEYSA